MKTATVWIEDAAFALLFRPHLGAFDISATGNFPSKEKRDANAQELAREGGGTAQLDLTDALQTFSVRLTDCPFRLLRCLLFTNRPGIELLAILRNLCLEYYRPFSASSTRGTKPPLWRAKVALGQDKKKKRHTQEHI